MSLPSGPTVQIEAWLLQRLSAPALFDGITTPEERRERVRRVIVNRGLELAIAGRREGHACESWAEVYSRVYNRDLHEAP